MVVMLRTKGLFRLIEETKEEPDSDKDKSKYMNRFDEAHGHLFFSVFVSTFQIVRLTTPNWKIPTLNAFMKSFISHNDKLIQIGTIRASKDLALVAR